ncbi:aldo/keto reductase [Sorangium sp. So ce385]|uniref:aldo/keto reductase n=1 Tax=Sorangium sp. So ce385 TaxID=3133308 RepID=UPI003F5C2540
MKRRWESVGIETSALGLGCWAIAGKWNDPGASWEWHGTDDAESIRALRAGIDAGVTLLDTADVYGSGHSEVLVGKAIQGIRDRVTLATKFGHVFDEEKHVNLGRTDASPAYIRRAVEGSLRRLGTDRIDLYQLHIWEHPPQKAGEVVEVLEQLVKEGKIRAYGWSTDVKASVEAFARGPHCGAAQILLNVFEGNDRLIAYGEGKGLALLCRSPLAMGMLSGRYTKGETLPRGDVRTSNFEWITWFKDGKVNPNYARRLEAAREILTSNGRTLVQGALAWIWAKSPNTIPIPGFKSTAQAVENARAMEKGALTAEQARQVAELVAYEDRNL